MQQLGQALLNIGRMGPGRAGYYLTAVVRGEDGVEGYYLARGEEPGRWLGHGAELLGLSGEVTGEQLRAVLDARHPSTGEQLSMHPARKVPGFDHTFRAPKSVSLLWALGDRDTSVQVVASHDAAVDAAIGYLQRAAGFSRRGAGGSETVPVDGFVAAAFRHRTSRADDPLLHTHVLVANLARTCDDGVWRTLDSRKLFAHAKTAGVLYQAHLRHELTVRLGVGWQHVSNGHADIAGVDRGLIEVFSQRRNAIVAHMADRGESSAAAAQTATLATRQAKSERASEAELRDMWAVRAAAAGVRPGWQQQLTGKVTWEQPGVAELWQQLVVDEQLTETSSSFTRRDLLQQIAERLPVGAPVEWCERVAQALLTHDPDLLVALGPTRGQLTSVDVIRRQDGRVVPVDAGERRYTTRGLLLTEHRAINRSLDRTDSQVAVVDDRAVEQALRRRTLSGEQETMVRRLTSSGAGVQVVVGKAGTGKTYALDAARDAWQTAGIQVTGVALAARAALELEQSAGIRSTTLARLLSQLDDQRHDSSPLKPGSVLVVDEAGMIGTRQLARLLDHTERRQVKIVLVGDPHQLPEIDAGGLFRALTTRLPAIELTANRRQAHTWEQAALDELRHGNPDTALATYSQYGRIRTADTTEAVRDQLVNDWWDTARDDLPGSIMIALRRDDVAELNHRARTKMLADGRLTGSAVRVGDVEFQSGDRIVCLRNAPSLDVVNGTRATITRIDPTRRTVHALDDRSVQLILPAGYLDAGHVAHGYAITGHKAQGLTCDHTYTLGTETLYREWGYVAMSRGRITNQLYHAPTDREDEGLHHHVHIDDRDEVASLTSRLRRSRAEQPITPELIGLASRWRELDARLDAIDIPRQQQLLHVRDRLADARRMLEGDVERLRNQLERETAGFPWPKRRRLVEQLGADHDRTLTKLKDVTGRLADIDTTMAHEGLPDRRQLGELYQRRDQADTELRRAAAIRTRAQRTDPPDHLTGLLGQRPTHTHATERWDQTATRIEHHRLRWQITDTNDPLGDRHPNPTTRHHAAALHAEIRHQTDQLRHDAPVRSIGAIRR